MSWVGNVMLYGGTALGFIVSGIVLRFCVLGMAEEITETVLKTIDQHKRERRR